MRKLVGSDVYGYWELFNEPDSHVVCEKNVSDRNDTRLFTHDSL